jgi:DNA-binding CsgD family transcriptional regulator
MAVTTTRAAGPGGEAGAALGPEAAYVAARASRDVRDRLPARALEALIAAIPATLALAFTVDEHDMIGDAVALWGPGPRGEEAAAILQRLHQLESVDPFSPRRAQASGAAVISEADVGGRDALAQSLFGRDLRRHGCAAPLFAYFRREGRVVAGIGLLRTVAVPPFEPSAVRLLRELHPLLEHALACGTAAVPGREGDCLARLTVREVQVAELVTAGVSNACIAATLGMSEATVKSHLTRIYAKAGVRSRTELAVQIGRRS